MNKSSRKPEKCNKVVDEIYIDGILTARTCADIVVEIIKVVCHQKLQIPYKYEMLKLLVDKKNEIDKEISVDKPTTSWQSQKHFRTVTTALNVLDLIFRNLLKEIESLNPPQEAYIVLGSTPTTPKEVFRIIFPENLHLHYHQNHLSTSRNVVYNTMRKITTSESLSKTIYQPIQPTNTCILLNRRRNNGIFIGESGKALSEFFHPVHSLKIPPKVNETVIQLKYSSSVDANCCNQMVIFDDFSLKCNMDDKTNCTDDNSSSTILLTNENDSHANINVTCSINSESDVKDCTNKCSETDLADVNKTVEEYDWFQASLVLKGFKDCFINGRSISNSWCNS